MVVATSSFPFGHRLGNYRGPFSKLPLDLEKIGDALFGDLRTPRGPFGKTRDFPRFKWRPRRDLNPCYRRERWKERRSQVFVPRKIIWFLVRPRSHRTPVFNAVAVKLAVSLNPHSLRVVQAFWLWGHI
jgi:hypothetical protein